MADILIKGMEIPKPTFAPYQSLFCGCGINYPRCKEDCYWYREEQDMGAHNPYCQIKGGNYIEPEDCENCEHYHSKYKKTNADRIRSMTDEELAEWFGKIQYDTAYYFSGEDKQEYPYPDGWLDWLKQEAKGKAMTNGEKFKAVVDREG